MDSGDDGEALIGQALLRLQDGVAMAMSHVRQRVASQLLPASSSRFSMLRYRSDLLKYLETLLFLPAFLSGATEQKQMLEVELFSDYTDDPYSPSVTAVIEILSNKVQIYSSHLYIHAHFSGLRYLIFNFPLLSALVGISSNFIFLSFLFVLSYMRLLLKVEWGPEQHRADGLLSDRDENVKNNQQEDGKNAAGATSVIPGSPLGLSLLLARMKLWKLNNVTACKISTKQGDRQRDVAR
ncbi:Seipin [Larimichthys crocea]|uniref:Uncharacterized protein n=1 Tax=Larimichthys crocea TaxID=215358 RepID=A0ACD3RCZ7_LARCR|nr:Seipin [Larimichthys crocea]